MEFEDWFLLACLAAAIPSLYRAWRVLYFEHPAKASAFYDWISHTYPDVWSGLPKWEQKYLNPQFAINRIRRERLISDPEFERRWSELRHHQSLVLRPLLKAVGLAVLGLTPRLLNLAGRVASAA